MYEITTKPVIISCSITGNKTTLGMNPNLPITPKQQGIAAAEAVAAGASIIHLHVRNDDGSESHRRERFEEAVSEIRRRAPDAIIEISTRGAVTDSMEYRGKPLEVQSEMASLNISSLNIGDEVFLNEPLEVKRLAKKIYDSGKVPEIDVFDLGQMESVFSLRKAGVLRDPLNILLVLGISGGMSADPRNLTHLVSLLPPGTHWSSVGIGRFQLNIAVQTLLMGGHVRVGLEDTAYYRKGELAKSNAQLVERIVRISRELGREIATPDQAREMLGIGQVNSPAATVRLVAAR